jgi:hypothetical protein
MAKRRKAEEPETIERRIKLEVRLAALEDVLCQYAAALYAVQPQFLDFVKRRALAAARTKTFPGYGPFYSDLISAEFEEALQRLYSAIEQHVNDLQKRPQR